MHCEEAKFNFRYMAVQRCLLSDMTGANKKRRAFKKLQKGSRAKIAREPLIT